MACIVQWNLQSLRTKFSDLKILIADLSPAILCLQETLIGTRCVNPPSGYTLVQSLPVRADGHERGAAILIDKRIHTIRVPLRTTLQAVAIRAWLGKWYTICSLYLPHVPTDRHDLSDLLTQLQAPYLLLGDMNAKSPMWGNTALNDVGRHFEYLLLNYPISLLNDGTPTHFHCQTGTYSTIDLSLCSSSIVTDFTYNVTADLRGSDHYPVQLTLTSPPPPPSRSRRVLEARADWAVFHSLTETNLDIDDFDDIDGAVAEVSEVFIGAARNSIPLSSETITRRPVPWWDAECRTVFQQRRRAERALRRVRSQHNIIMYQRLKAMCRVVFSKARRDSWRAYLSSINSRLSLHKVWKKVQKISGKFSPTPLPILRSNDGTYISEPLAVASSIASAFAGVSKDDNYSQAFLQFRRRAESRQHSFNTDFRHSYNSTFTKEELSHALSISSNSSPGQDQISYTMIRRAHHSLQNVVLNLFNRIFIHENFPSEWRNAIVIPLPKPGRAHNHPLDFRPIALTSCLCKLLEKMINIRLISFLETNNLLGGVQFGYRPNKSTSDNLIQFEHDLFETFNRKLHTIAIFFDLKKAYDMAWRWKVLDQLHEFGLRGHLPIFVRNFLERRFIRVRVGTTLSDPIEVPQGTPQGSVLSCTCFLLAIHSISAYLPTNIRSSLYVDDFTIYFSGSSTRIVEHRLQQALSGLEQWSDHTGFVFSLEKTIAMHICRVRSCPHTAHNLTLYGQALQVKSEHKYLGLIVDEKLDWKKHISYLRNSSLKTLSLLRHLTSLSWGADMQSLLRLYIMLLKPKLDYGSEVYATSPTVATLEPIQNEVMRIASGAFRSSPIPSLLAVTNLKPLSHYRFIKLINTYLRIQSSPSHPLRNMIRAVHAATHNPLTNVTDPLPRISSLYRGHLLCEYFRIPVDSLLPDITPPRPLWSNAPPTVCDQLFIYTKGSINPEVLKQKFIEHMHTHPTSYIVFTDGSRTARGVSFAVVAADGWRMSKRISDCASIFTAELLAIDAALHRSSMVAHDEVVICSDSRSSIVAINGLKSCNPLIHQIQQTINNLSKRVILCWVPSHVGVPLNEECDALAKRAQQLDVQHASLPRSDLKSLAKSSVKASWHSIWREIANNKLRAVIGAPCTSYPEPSSREWDIRLSRLRIGHSKLTHGFLMEHGQLPYCDDCIVPLTIHHILLQCPSYHDERIRYFGADVTLHNMLFACDLSLNGPLFSFVQSIDLFHKL